VSVIPYFSAVTALAGLMLAFYFNGYVNSQDEGTDVMKRIAKDIREGSQAFLREEYKWVGVFVAAMAVLIFVVLDFGKWGALAYLCGAGFSALAGVIGMQVATAANVRTAAAAMSGGAAKALPLAFRGGAVMGFTVAGLGLFGISLAYIVFVDILQVTDAFQVVATFGLGGSSIALFARIGGGIYTKAADVGADLVGKVEAGIPEDDPRNPATIADNVGDNVGDVAGMGADLFESYAGSIVAPMVLASLLFIPGQINGESLTAIQDTFINAMFLFPLLIAGLGMIFSIVGALLVKGKDGKSLAAQLHFGTNVAMLLTAVFGTASSLWLFSGDVIGESIKNPIWLGLTIPLGLAAGYLIGFTSEYYTSTEYEPVKKLAAQSETGSATVIIAGIADGMLSTVASVILVVTAIGGAYFFGTQVAVDPLLEVSFGLYGAALAAIGMLATTGAVVAVDAYGPISDNAGGIAEMAHLPKEVRDVTDSLDSLGNTTAAVAKGFAIGSAAITALALFRSFTAAVSTDGNLNLDITEVPVLIGLFLGGMITFAFAALTLKSVGRAAQAMIVEVRRQFAEIPGLREGKEGAVADHAKCIEISTKASLREMVLPGGLAIVLPLAIGFVSTQALGGFLAGALVTGFMLAIFMSNAGGAWDNAKKYIEAGAHGGKGSEQHKAAVTGDTVGDPFKDTSGPAMNILIKVMTIVSLVFAPAFL
jgi:K(+)-stimulated pyrophosphate-energized sodium pump